MICSGLDPGFVLPVRIRRCPSPVPSFAEIPVFSATVATELQPRRVEPVKAPLVKQTDAGPPQHLAA